MKYQKYILVLTGIAGTLVYFFYRNLAVLGLCSEVSILSSGAKFCDSTVGWGDYFKPLWDFSRALMVVGLLACVRTRTQKTLFWWSIIAALVTTVAVIIAPSMSSDFLVPIEKKTVGTLLAFGYFAVSVIIVLWDLFRKGK